MKETQSSIIPQLDGYSKDDPQYVVSSLDGYKLLAFTSSGNVTSEPIPVMGTVGYSVACVVPSTGTPNGVIKLQGCNDKERSNGKPDSTLTNWFDVPSGGARVNNTGAAAALNGTYFLCDPECTYRWMRVVYTRSSGSITITVKVQGRGE